MAIPKELEEKYNEIAHMIVKFCDEKLNDEYKSLCMRLLQKLSRKRPSPLLRGSTSTWAAGIVYAIGQNNFIFDKSQEIYMTASELSSGFGISASTAGAKAAEIRKMCNINYFNHEWLLADLVEDNSMIWYVMVNGIIVDIRDMSPEIQRQAFEKGIIPYIPGEKEKNTGKISVDRIVVTREKKQKAEDPSQSELPF